MVTKRTWAFSYTTHRFAMGKATISKHSLLPASLLGKERVGYNSEHNKAGWYAYDQSMGDDFSAKGNLKQFVNAAF